MSHQVATLLEVAVALFATRGLLALDRSRRRRRSDEFGTTHWLRKAAGR